ncbi:plastid division protein PDV1-like [Curcuma longa]|uniref:plastid division protein PDV1-like n=1 Tax=Curcuma longa TaxID=136217 RepID=UPI003D9EBCA6
MRWEMEMEEVEAVLERIWDLHDKISDAIHTISRAHFLRLVKDSRGGRDQPPLVASEVDDEGDGKGGFIYVKEFGVEVEDEGGAMAEARSLNAIRSALENLEDQLEFFHTVQAQQRAERVVAIARLKQSRVVLAKRLADHRGKKYKVIEDALAFVGDVHDVGSFVRPETLYENEITGCQSGKNLEGHEEKQPSMFVQVFLSSFTAAKRSIRLVGFQGILGNAAIFAASMLAFLQLNRVAFNGGTALTQDQAFYRRRNESDFMLLDKSSKGNRLKHLDVLSARG